MSKGTLPYLMKKVNFTQNLGVRVIYETLMYTVAEFPIRPVNKSYGGKLVFISMKSKGLLLSELLYIKSP